jgi:hypothetical protein
MEDAAGKGYLHMVKWLSANFGQDEVMMYAAATMGHLHIVKWLHENTSISEYSDISDIIAQAARSGHLHVVEWLYYNCIEDNADMETAMCMAASFGHLHVVEWLHMNVPGCDAREWVDDIEEMADQWDRAAITKINAAIFSNVMQRAAERERKLTLALCLSRLGLPVEVIMMHM